MSDDLFSQFDQIFSKMNMVKSYVSVIQQELKTLEKGLKKEMRELKKEASKPKNKGNRQPSGFAKPSKVTKELCEFMNKAEGTEIARTEVTRALVAYIKENKLENVNNSKIIQPDDKLKNLLGLENGNELTYFNIQKYMNKHFSNGHQ